MASSRSEVRERGRQELRQLLLVMHARVLRGSGRGEKDRADTNSPTAITSAASTSPAFDVAAVARRPHKIATRSRRALRASNKLVTGGEMRRKVLAEERARGMGVGCVCGVLGVIA